MYVQLLSGGYRAISEYDGFSVTHVEAGYVITDLEANSSNAFSTTYSTEDNAQAALVTFMAQFALVVQPPTD